MVILLHVYCLCFPSIKLVILELQLSLIQVAELSVFSYFALVLTNLSLKLVKV